MDRPSATIIERWEIITSREVIRGVLSRFEAQYSHYPRDHAFPRGPTVGGIVDRLSALDLAAATRQDVDVAMGLEGWASLRCDCCDQEAEALLRIGDKPDYEARWQDLCVGCLQNAAALMAAQAVHGEQIDQARMNTKPISGDPK